MDITTIIAIIVLVVIAIVPNVLHSSVLKKLEQRISILESRERNLAEMIQFHQKDINRALSQASQLIEAEGYVWVYPNCDKLVKNERHPRWKTEIKSRKGAHK